MSQLTKTCHYITRSLTRPWEGDQRRLHFFDFDTAQFSYGPSATMFAELEINSQEVETWLDKTIENPLSAWRSKLTAADPPPLDDWSFYRAASLMLWLQGVRVHSVTDHDARRHLEKLAVSPLEETDQLVVAFRAEYDLCLVTTVAAGLQIAPLFVPSTGIFPVPLPDTGCLSGYSVGLALPLDVHCALLARPADRHGTTDTSRVPGSISNLSVGTAGARRVVVPPTIFDATSEGDLRAALLDLRQMNDTLSAAVQDKRRLVAEMYEKVGLQPVVDGAGRVRPPAT